MLELRKEGSEGGRIDLDLAGKEAGKTNGRMAWDLFWPWAMVRIGNRFSRP